MGGLYQWGRCTDGHQQYLNFATTNTLSTTDTPGHGDFITAVPAPPFDWRSPSNNNLWQGVNGINNPCPSGYRIPTHTELEAERVSWTSNNPAGAFASPLKLTAGGARMINGTYNSIGQSGCYWSSTINGNDIKYLNILPSSAAVLNGRRVSGFSVRCIKD